jgi:arsenite methyltransferase
LDDIPDALLSSFCGVGNPFSIDDIASGSAILDIGSGAGFDLIVASRLTGPDGSACGIDLTVEMVARAKETVQSLGIDNIEVNHISSEKIPFKDQAFDVVVSNGVINLSPCKLELFKEIYRVLKPGGRLQFADIVLDRDLPAGMAGNLEAWSQ